MPDAPRPLTVHYWLEDTAIFGGVKVILRQANLMARRGHRVSVVATAPPPDWFDLEAEFVHVPRLGDLCGDSPDVTVASYWTTLEPAARAPGSAIHFCQGYEGSFTHNRDEHPAIEKAYGRPMPAMTVAPHLASFLEERFGRPARVVAQPLEPWFRPGGEKSAPGRPARVLIVGPREIDWKGVATSLEALRRLGRSLDVELVRLSQWEPSPEERDQFPGEYHVRVAPSDVARLMRRVDLLLAASWEQEGFGLPVLEAMASGVPVVASDIPSYRWFASEAACLVPFDEPQAFAEAAERLLRDAGRYRAARAAGLSAAGRFDEDRAGADAEQALYWAASLGPDVA